MQKGCEKKGKSNTYDVIRHDRWIRVYLQAIVVADLLANLLAAAGGAHFSVFRTRNGAGFRASTCRRNRGAPVAPDRPTDRPIPRAIEATIRVGAALPPAAYDAPIGVTLTGIPRKSASSATSTSICLARSDREDRSREDDRSCEKKPRTFYPPSFSSAPHEKDRPPRGRSSFTGEPRRVLGA